jgi:hypothetical protein
MKKIIVIFILISFLRFSLFGQNLVQNGSFETFISNTIPTSNTVDSLYSWSSANCSCDFMSSIIPLPCCTTPNSTSGYQKTRTGKNYGRFVYYSYANHTPQYGYTENFQVHLLDTLVSNKAYNIRAYLSLAGRHGIHVNLYAFDSLGFILSDTFITHQCVFPMSIEPDIIDTSGYYDDTLNWMEVGGTYIANGGEEYLLIGFQMSMSNSYNLPLVQFFGYPNGNVDNIYYLDDVAIWPADTIPPPANAGQDTTICRGGKARLGTHNYSDYIYEWRPSITLSNDSGGLVWASPDTTTTYYLQATDDIYTKTMDSVTVFVNNCGQNDTTVCIEQQFTIGSTNNPNWNYQWTPSTGLSSDTVGMPLCSLLSNQSYQLLITNNSGDTIALDSTNLIVGSCFYAGAGIDSLICKGDSLVIGMQNLSFLDFKWWPNFMISDTAVGNPSVWPDTLTWYYLQLTDTMGNVSFDSVLVDVQICAGINTAFPFENGLRVYPNPSSTNITFEFEEPIKIKQVNIYNSHGQLIDNMYFDFIKDKYVIDLKGKQKGLYFLIIKTKNNLYFKKIIIE